MPRCRRASFRRRKFEPFHRLSGVALSRELPYDQHRRDDSFFGRSNQVLFRFRIGRRIQPAFRATQPRQQAFQSSKWNRSLRVSID